MDAAIDSRGVLRGPCRRSPQRYSDARQRFLCNTNAPHATEGPEKIQTLCGAHVLFPCSRQGYSLMVNVFTLVKERRKLGEESASQRTDANRAAHRI